MWAHTHVKLGTWWYVLLFLVGLDPSIVTAISRKQMGALLMSVVIEPLEEFHVELEFAFTHLFNIDAL